MPNTYFTTVEGPLAAAAIPEWSTAQAKAFCRSFEERSLDIMAFRIFIQPFTLRRTYFRFNGDAIQYNHPEPHVIQPHEDEKAEQYTESIFRDNDRNQERKESLRKLMERADNRTAFESTIMRRLDDGIQALTISSRSSGSGSPALHGKRSSNLDTRQGCGLACGPGYECSQSSIGETRCCESGLYLCNGASWCCPDSEGCLNNFNTGTFTCG